MSPLVKSHHEFLVEDLDCGRYVKQVSEYRLRGRLPVLVADPIELDTRRTPALTAVGPV